MGVSTSAGAKLYIGTTASVGSTDSFTPVGDIVTLPEFGRVYTEVKFLPLDSRGVQKFKGSYDDGSLAVTLGKDLTDAGQLLLVTALDVDADYNFKIVDNDASPGASATGVSISAATPGVVTDTAHGLPAGTAVKFTAGSGTLPTGIVDGTTYYVIAAGLVTNAYEVSATLGGSAINTTGSPTGTYTRTTLPNGSTQLFKAKVMSHTTKRDGSDAVIMSTVSLGIKAGSIVETVHS